MSAPVPDEHTNAVARLTRHRPMCDHERHYTSTSHEFYVCMECDATAILASTDDAVLDALEAALVRAGRLTEEWLHVNESGGGSFHRSREAAEDAMRKWEERRTGKRLWIDEPPPPPSAGIRRRLIGREVEP